MAAIVSLNSPSRPAGALINDALIPLTIDANSATYAASSGGLPVDLATILNQAAPFNGGGVNSGDILGIIGITAAGYVPGQFAVGTPTYNTTTDTSTRTKTSYATCPCTFKLWNGTTQFSDGACTQVLTGWLIVARGGSLNA